jgi:hypothetical protein
VVFTFGPVCFQTQQVQWRLKTWTVHAKDLDFDQDFENCGIEKELPVLMADCTCQAHYDFSENSWQNVPPLTHQSARTITL